MRRDLVFKEGVILEAPNEEVLALTAFLEEMELLEVEQAEVVRCIHSRDLDQGDVRDHCCPGVCVLSDELDEENHEFRCQCCARVLFPSQKQSFHQVRLWPQRESMAMLVEDELRKVHLGATRAVTGLWRVPTPAGEVEVCLVDVCPDRSVLHHGYARAGMVVFVVGNLRDFTRFLPADVPVVSLLDLALQGAAVLRAVVIRLGRAVAADPGLLCVAEGMPPVPYQPRPSPFPGVQTHQAPRGTRWGQVKVYQVDGLTVQLHVPGRRPQSYTAAELGMASKRSKNRSVTKKWRILMALCEGNGTCGWRGFASSFDAFKVQVSAMRPLLSHIFGIDGDPFMACTRSGGLRAAFLAGPVPEEEVYVGDVVW